MKRGIASRLAAHTLHHYITRERLRIDDLSLRLLDATRSFSYHPYQKNGAHEKLIPKGTRFASRLGSAFGLLVLSSK